MNTGTRCLRQILSSSEICTQSRPPDSTLINQSALRNGWQPASPRFSWRLPLSSYCLRFREPNQKRDFRHTYRKHRFQVLQRRLRPGHHSRLHLAVTDATESSDQLCGAAFGSGQAFRNAAPLSVYGFSTSVMGKRDLASVSKRRAIPRRCHAVAVHIWPIDS